MFIHELSKDIDGQHDLLPATGNQRTSFKMLKKLVDLVSDARNAVSCTSSDSFGGQTMKMINNDGQRYVP